MDITDAAIRKAWYSHKCELGRRIWMFGMTVTCKTCGPHTRVWGGWTKTKETT